MDPGSTPVHRSEMHTGEGCAWDLLLVVSAEQLSYSPYSVVVVGFDYQVCCGFVHGLITLLTSLDPRPIKTAWDRG